MDGGEGGINKKFYSNGGETKYQIISIIITYTTNLLIKNVSRSKMEFFGSGRCCY